MITYWELYVAYVNRCVEDNYKNDIDPNHYEMEWNHWLPRACFPDLPLGQWLTLRQHAIASALQSLALGKNCMFGYHKKYLPAPLLELAWPIFCGASVFKAAKTNEDKHENGKSVNASKGGKKAAEKLHEEKDENGKSVNAVKGGKKGGKKSHEEKDENGKSVNAMRGATTTIAKYGKKVELSHRDGRVLVFPSVGAAIKELGLDDANIRRVCRGSQKQHKGWTARHLSPVEELTPGALHPADSEA